MNEYDIHVFVHKGYGLEEELKKNASNYMYFEKYSHRKCTLRFFVVLSNH